MMMDPGCISMVVEDVGQSGVLIAIICFLIVIFGMISLSGMVIGYVTTAIEDFLDQSQSSSRPLVISDHFVIMNWNNRAAEIVNDLLYLETPQKVVVLVSEDKERIERQIEEKIAATLARENENLMKHFGRNRVSNRHIMKNNLTVIVREVDLFSTKMLLDSGIDKAKSIIILGADETKTTLEEPEEKRGNVQTIKTLMQVADLTGRQSSRDDQTIVVEITDPWTQTRVNHIIEFKQVEGKCNIIPVHINQMLGQILSQFTIMPELNTVYSQLFSNFGATIFSEERENLNEAYVDQYLSSHAKAIPLVISENASNQDCYFMADSMKDVHTEATLSSSPLTVQMCPPENYTKKTVILIGANSRYDQLIESFKAYLYEWPNSAELIIIDDRKNLERNSFYANVPFVIQTIPVEYHDSEGVRNTVKDILKKQSGDISILILSDDRVDEADIDADALSNLIFIQTLLNEDKAYLNTANRRIDVIVELIDPKHHDIVTSYNVDNIVISNRYISKMITQIGEKKALYDFFSDILTYDQDISEDYTSKEIYVRRATDIFKTLPPKTTAYNLICAVSHCPENTRHSMLLGYIRGKQDLHLFSGELRDIDVELKVDDKLIFFSTHI
ncbi:MAG: hypothetical protein Q4B26_13905, partial [Eubacteriales bacterium]|nr:hypothetical protein [Eubacteriales bacterium]